jgi:hypothetical protein
MRSSSAPSGCGAALLHRAAYVDPAEPDRAVVAAAPGLTPIAAFLHSTVDRENEMRASFSRVYVCRRFSQPL